MTNKYNNAKIYKIFDNTNGNTYYGSTCQSLSRRLSVHKAAATHSEKTGKAATKSKSIILNGDYSISLVEEVNCQNKDQMIARERYYIESFPCVNKNIPGRTKQESQKFYYDTHQEKYQEHRDSRRESRKEYDRNRYLAKKQKLLAELKTLEEMEPDSDDSNA